ncbi:MAG: type II secretion system protein [Candidatus Omnitrophota bacterium]
MLHTKINMQKDSNKGFSMVEMMIAVIIVGVCMVASLRVFFVCTLAVSGAKNSISALEAIRDKMDALKINVVENGGVDLASQIEEDILLADGNKLAMHSEILEWKAPVAEEDAAESVSEQEEQFSGLCEVFWQFVWGDARGDTTVKMKNILPFKGYRQQFYGKQ